MSDENKIAIIGFSVNVPGAEDADAFYKLVSGNKTGLKESSKAEQQDSVSSDVYGQEAFINIGGGPEDYQTFDASFFGYSPKEAKLMDPQTRKALEYAYKAVEHAGYAPTKLTASTGCFVANSVNSYFYENLSPLFHDSDDAEKNQMMFLNEADFLSTRLSYHFNWQGASFTIKCGCSSSMIAIHEACKSLLQFDIDIALAGGVAIKSRYQYGYLYEQDGILSADGRCCPFSDDATGTVFANGLGFVVLKRLEDAIADNDTIHAVILSSFVNNDGNNKVGYMAPSVEGQKHALQTALAYAEIKPQQVSYIEGHATGTAIGDPIEYKGLTEVFSECKPDSIALRAVKGNIGHLDAASGVVGLIKVILDIKHSTISPNHHFKSLNSKCDNDKSPFTLNTKLMPWEPLDDRRIAVVSSFGIGGTNGQLILEEFPTQKEDGFYQPNQYFIPLSAKTVISLKQKVESLAKWLTAHDVNLADLMGTLLLGREHFKYRIAYHVTSKTELLEQLTAFNEKEIKECQTHNQISLTNDLYQNPASLKEHYLQGDDFDGSKLDVCSFKRIPLPSYPFDKIVHWIKPNEHKNSKIKEVSRWFYLPNWQRQELPSSNLSDSPGNILLFDDGGSLCTDYKKHLKARGAVIYTVTAGEQFCLSDHQFIINPASKSDYLDLFSSLSSQSISLDSIIHCWTLDKVVTSYDVFLKFGLYALLYCMQALDQSKMRLPSVMQIITSHSANVSGRETIQPYNSMLLGMSQVLPKEYEAIACQLLDIDSSANTNLICQQLLSELLRGHSCELALRGYYRFAKAYQPIRLQYEQLGELSIAGSKNYLVIGGLGNFGMELAEFIGARHKGMVFLTTRMNFPSRDEWSKWVADNPENTVTQKIRQLLAIEAQGAKVHVLTADVCDKQSLKRVKNHIETEFGFLAGVVHAAGIVDSGMISHKTIESLEQVFAAKVHGTKNVCDVFLSDSLDFLILCSSMNAIIGGLGQMDNTAANAFIDAYAEYCLYQGYNNVLAINWGAVNEARARNYATQPQFSQLSEEHVKNKMSKEEIFDVYHRLFSTQLSPRVVVSTIDFNQVIENWSRVGSLNSLISNTIQTKRIRKDLQNLNLPASEMEHTIAELWKELLGIDIVVSDDDFFSLGGNSLVAIQFIAKLTKHYPIKMHAMAIYEYPKLNEFAGHAAQLLREAEEKSALMDIG